MADLFEYEKITGRIVNRTKCSDNAVQFIAGPSSPENALSFGIAGEHQYMDITQDPHVLIDKVTMVCSVDKTTVAVDGIDFVTVSNAPVGSKFYADGVFLGEGDGSPQEIEFDLVGPHTVLVTLFPYLNWEKTIAAI